MPYKKVNFGLDISKIKASNLSIWAVITALAILLSILGLWYCAAIVYIVVGLNDLLRIFIDKDRSITSRIREEVGGQWAVYVVTASWILAFILGYWGIPSLPEAGFHRGVAVLDIAVTCTLLGHLVWFQR